MDGGGGDHGSVDWMGGARGWCVCVGGSTHSSGRVSSLMFCRFTSSGNDELRPRPLAAVSSCFLALRRRPLLLSSLLLPFPPFGLPRCASSLLLSYLEHGGASDLLLLLRLVFLSSFCVSRLLLLLQLLRRLLSHHHLLLPLLLLLLLPCRCGLDRGDRDWCAGVGADGPGRAPSPPHSMLDSGRGEEEQEEGRGCVGEGGGWRTGDVRPEGLQSHVPLA